MENEEYSSVIELKPPSSLYDSGSEVWGPKIKNAVDSMISTGCVVIVYSRQTLDSLYRNVYRKNLKRNPGKAKSDPGFVEHFKLWTHQMKPKTDSGEGEWMVRLRRPGESTNPFYVIPNHTRYGQWLVMAEKLLAGEEVIVATSLDVRRLSQSFRVASDRRGYYRDGRMLRTEKIKGEKGKDAFRVYRVKEMRKIEDLAAELKKKEAVETPVKAKKTKTKVPKKRNK